jgi:hypothetical protein
MPRPAEPREARAAGFLKKGVCVHEVEFSSVGTDVGRDNHRP